MLHNHLVLKTKTADIDTLARVARLAAAKIPPGGITPLPAAATSPPPVPVTTETVFRAQVQPASSPLQLSGPVTVRASAADTVGTITFSLTLGAGNAPVDMGMVQYTVSTLKNLRAAKYGDPAVRVTLTDVQGTRNNLLETGETATVELDTGRMGFTAATLGADDRVTIEVRPAIGASLPFARTIPPRMEAGATYRVY